MSWEVGKKHMKKLFIFLTFAAVFLLIFISSSIGPMGIIKKVPITSSDEACLIEILDAASDGKGQGYGVDFVTGKVGSNIYIKSYTLGNKWGLERIVDCSYDSGVPGVFIKTK